NALIDAAVVATTGGVETCDRGGARAARGTVDEALLALLLDDFYLAQPPPKTTGKERYHHRFTEAALDELGRDPAPDRLVATLPRWAASPLAPGRSPSHHAPPRPPDSRSPSPHPEPGGARGRSVHRPRALPGD